jgi:hypothetical protein
MEKENNEHVDCRFVYSPHQSNADIQFIQNGKIVCSAKTVDSTHLPLPYQVQSFKIHYTVTKSPDFLGTYM